MAQIRDVQQFVINAEGCEQRFIIIEFNRIAFGRGGTVSQQALVIEGPDQIAAFAEGL